MFTNGKKARTPFFRPFGVGSGFCSGTPIFRDFRGKKPALSRFGLFVGKTEKEDTFFSFFYFYIHKDNFFIIIFPLLEK